MIKSFATCRRLAAMHAPRLTFRSPTLSVPYFSLDGIMENRNKRTLDQMLSRGEEEAPVRHPRAWSPPPQCLSHWIETSGPVFAFEMKFVRESSSIENAQIILAWTRSDTAGVVKNRLLGLDVLTEFFTDVFEFQGTIVAHNLCWKSTILEAQFSRFGLRHLAACWRTFTQRIGLCLMSPEIGSWLGLPAGDYNEYRTSMGDLCRAVSQNYEPEATTRDGALQCLAILKCLRQHALPPCARGEAPHDFSAASWQHCGMRDNGEMPISTCLLCGHRS